jgi:hypothetical protein
MSGQTNSPISERKLQRARDLYVLLTVAPLTALFIIPHLPPPSFLLLHAVRVGVAALAVLLVAIQMAALLFLRKLGLSRTGKAVYFFIWLFHFVPAAVSWSLLFTCMLIGSACE